MFDNWGGKGLDDLAYDRACEAGRDVSSLEGRLELLEEYLGLEWSEDKGKYYKAVDLQAAEAGRANTKPKRKLAPSSTVEADNG